MRERLIQGLEAAGYKKHGRVSKIASLTGYSIGQVSDMLAGKVSLNDKFIRLVCSETKINLNWLESGTPPMFAEEKEPPRLDGTRKVDGSWKLGTHKIIIEDEPILTELIHEMMKLPKSKQARYLADLIAETEDEIKQEGKDGNKHSGNK